MHGNFFADHFQGGGRHFDHAPRLLPYAGIILTMSCIVIFLLRQYVIEPLVTKCYGKKYTDLDEAQRRSLVNHFVAGGCKFFLVAFSLYPAFAILSGKKSLESPYATSRHVKIGDGLIFTFEIFTAMYIFELFFRKKVSWISAAHHIGAITIAQTGTVLFLDPTHRQDAQIEFVMCLLWGIFDIVAEFWPHLAIIFYRTWPNSHESLYRIFLFTVFIECLGTVVETITVMSIFGQLWDHWTLEFKILTPVLHVLFTLAQLWGSVVFWRMAQKHKKLSREQDGEMQQSMPAPMMMRHDQEHMVEETHKFNAKGEQIV